MSGSSSFKLEKNIKSLDDIIYPEIEPAVINKQMIEKSYLETGYRGEEARLHQMTPVSYERITCLRLEFKNILRIDHLWILPNLTKLSLNCNKIEVIEKIEMLTSLTELDLSFNYIEKIENLDKLVKLEVLSLFNNLITKIENLDCLENLIILSIGKNKINTVDGIERFRFLKKMRVLNLEGNPIAENGEFPLSQYIAAILPHLKFYEYVAIAEDVREKAQQRFYREIREIESNEEIEISERKQRAKELYDAERLSKSFVEHLNEHQLYESLWKGDEDGRALKMVGVEAELLCDEYDKNIYLITQEIYKIGLEKYEEREIEIQEFMSSLEDGQKKVQKMGQDNIEDFLRYKDKIFENAGNCLKALELRIMNGEDEESPESIHLNDQFEKLTQEYEETISDIWQHLMGQELHLHEVIEETTVTFHRNIQEMVSKFVEQVSPYFAQLRDIALHFSEGMTDVVSHYIAHILASQAFDDVPPELQHCIEDHYAVMNLIAGMKETHIQRIDEREDRLAVRSREFIENMIDNLNEDELRRNRAKILEINGFLELMSQAMNTLRDEVIEEIANDEV